MGLENVDSVQHRTIAIVDVVLSGHRLVISGQRFQAHRFLLICSERNCRRHGRRDPCPQGDYVALAPRMNRIGEKNDVGVRRGVDPN